MLATKIEIEIDQIKIGQRLRKSDSTYVLELAKSIDEIGLINPITVTKDLKLIAGLHRIEAFKHSGKTIIPANVLEMDDLDAELAEIDENLIRNELHYIDRGIQLARRKEIYELKHPETKQGMRNGQTSKDAPSAVLETPSFVEETSNKTGKSQRAISEDIQIAHSFDKKQLETIKNANIGKKEALKLARIKDKNDRDQIIESLLTGEVKSVNDAILQSKKIEIRNQLKSQLTEQPKVYHESYETWLDKQPMADLLLTDPPYMTDVDDIEAFANDWLPKALNKVKSTGRAYVFVGAYPKELQAYLNVQIPNHIALEQVLVWTYRNTLGVSPKDRYIQNWQTILYFKGIDAGDLDCPITNEQWAVQDINAPDGRLGDRYHTWQKPIELAQRLIRHSTKQGDIIIDPFVCTGTFVLAASQLGRVGVGCDISKDNLDIAIARGCQLC